MNDQSRPPNYQPTVASPPIGTTGGNVQYFFTTAKAIRGREGVTRTKYQNQGWEFVSQAQGTLRSELTFRKVKPKSFGAYLAQGYAAFRRLGPTAQKRAVVGVGSLIALLVIFTGVAAALSGGEDSPQPTPPAAADSADPSTPTPQASPEATEEPTEELTEAATPTAEPYSYDGPEYDVVVKEQTPGPGKPTAYWIYTTAKLNFSNDAYKKQVKAIIIDIAREHGSADFFADVVTNKDNLPRRGNHYLAGLRR